ncbi:MAG TPA: putative metal-binding motif-containing protein [Polyangiaceae bacterium]|nr:putative metal-binding motif-containing protein [Polyangiaceae bacterium]
MGCDGAEPPARTQTQAAAVSCSARTCYRDADGDGKGVDHDAAPFTCGCPAGWAAVGGDCDDQNLNLWRLASCYPDGDGDGYGRGPAANVCAGADCASAGAAESAGDCNDQNVAVAPHRHETPANRVDDDCDGQTDEGTFDDAIYWRINATTSSRADVVVNLNHETEIAQQEQGGLLYGKIFYRPLAEASAPYHVTGYQPAELDFDGYGSYAALTLEGLEPLTAYEIRIDFYRLQAVLPGPASPLAYVRVAPAGACQGDSNATPPCSNTEALYTLTESAAGDASLAHARAALTKRALYWQWTSSSLPFDGNDSQYYADRVQYSLLAIGPETHRDAEALRAWFAPHPGALTSVNAPSDLAPLRPGDWVNDDADDVAGGGSSRMFLAYDAAAQRYWFVEGDARQKTPWGPVFHRPRVASRDRCGGEGPHDACAAPPSGLCPAGCERPRWAGKLKAAMLP